MESRTSVDLHTKDEKASKKKTKIYNETPLGNHMGYHGGVRNEDGKQEQQVSWFTAKEQHKKLGSSTLGASGLAFMDMLFDGAVVSGCPFAKFYASDAVGKLNYPMTTRIFNKDGSINEEQWNKLVGYTEKYNDKTILTESQLYKFVDDCRREDTNSDKLGLYKAINNAEWKLFWEKFSTGKLEDTGEKYISLRRLRKFYENTRDVGEKYEHKIAPGHR